MAQDSRSREAILQEMAKITRMERGKLSSWTKTKRLGKQKVQQGPYYKLQAWENGRNVTRYVPAQDAGALQEALAGHQRFEQLADEFVEVTVAQTRAAKDSGAKKNSRRSTTAASRKSTNS